MRFKQHQNFRPDIIDDDEAENSRTGALIGSLERLLIVIFLLVNQYAAIGLVFTAKSIARYKRISDEARFAEYYLLGILFSLLGAIVPFLVIW